MENTKGSNMDSVPISVASINERSENFMDHSKDQINPINQSQSPAPSSINMLSETQRPDYDVPNNESFVQCGLDASSSRNQKETGDHIMIRPFENAVTFTHFPIIIMLGYLYFWLMDKVLILKCYTTVLEAPGLILSV